MDVVIETAGTGPHLLLIHGWGMSSSVWNLLIPELQKRYQVSTVDLPGHGHSKHQSAWDIDEFVEALAGQVPVNCNVLGWSLGGMIALRLASQYRSHVTKLILLASSAKFVRSRDWLHAQPKAVLNMFVDKLLENPRSTLKRFLLLQTQGMENQSDLNKVINEVIVEDRLPNQDALISGLNILKSVDLRDDLRALNCPVSQIFGERDQLIPAAIWEDSKKLNSDIQTTIIEGAGHVPFLSHVEETLQSIDVFCSA